MACALDQQGLNFSKQTGQLNGLRVVIVAAGLQSSTPIPRHGMSRERDNRNVRRRRIGFEPLGSLPTVDHGQTHVHENQVWQTRRGHLDSRGSVRREHDLVALALQPAREHISVHFVVFNQQNFGHGFKAGRLRDWTEPRSRQQWFALDRVVIPVSWSPC